MAGTSVGLAPGGSGSGSSGSTDPVTRAFRPAPAALAGCSAGSSGGVLGSGGGSEAGICAAALRVADENLGSGGQASVVGGERHVHAGDEAADPVPFGIVLYHGLLEKHGVSPVPQVDAGVREGVDRLTVDDEPLDPGAPEAAVGAFPGRRRLDGHLDEAGGDLPPNSASWRTVAARPREVWRRAPCGSRFAPRWLYTGAVAGPRHPGL